MKLDVPFISQSRSVTCGPTSLYLVLQYFGIDITPEEVKRQSHQLSSGLTFCRGLCVAAAENDLFVTYITRNTGLPKTYDDYFEKTITEDDKKTFDELHEKLQQLNVVEIEDDISLETLLDYVSEDTLVLVTLNWKMIQGTEGFGGHFVSIIGYDDTTVIVHNTGAGKPQSHMLIEKELFRKAWADYGSDKNSIIISTSPIGTKTSRR